MSKLSITVLGAGINGLWNALLLKKLGHNVQLIEQTEKPFEAASSRYAGAMLAPFCEEEGAEPIIRELGLQSKQIWQQHYPEIHEYGTLVLTKPREHSELSRFARMTSGHEIINANQITELEPDLEGRFEQGLFYKDEAHMNPIKAMNFLLNKLGETGVGVSFADTTNKFSAPDWVIDCRGIQAKSKLENLRGVRGERVIIRSQDVKLKRPIRVLHPRFPIYIVPWDNGCYMIGATVVESDGQQNMTLKSALELLSTAYALHPAFAESEIIEFGAGIRPSFPDNIPRIIQDKKTLYVNGFYRHGFLLAPVIATMVADYISKGEKHSEIFLENLS